MASMMIIISITIHIIYYGIQFSLSDIGFSFVENSFFIGIGDFLGYLASGNNRKNNGGTSQKLSWRSGGAFDKVTVPRSLFLCFSWESSSKSIRPKICRHL